MLTNRQIKYIQSLSKKKFRQQHQAFIAEGTKIVGELLTAPFSIQAIYALPIWIAQHKQQLGKIQQKVWQISPQQLKKISGLKTPNQVLAIVDTPKYTYNAQDIQKGYSLVLDTIQDPGNLGTIIRIADWFDIPYIFCSPTCVDVFNPKVVQSAMGSLARVKVIYTPLLELLTKYKKLPIYGALLTGENIFTKTLHQNGLIVIGNESKGIHPNLQAYIHHPIMIPRKGKAESLNAAVATGIICSLLTKQPNKCHFNVIKH